MCEPIRIALVAEGPTDKIVVGAAIQNILGDTPFILRQLQPEESVAFIDPRPGTGWGGVHRWCRQAVERTHGAIETDLIFLTYGALVLQLDSDVARERYANAGINDWLDDLPCVRDCPPASATTDELKRVLLNWIGRTELPSQVALCVPSANSEAWVLCALYPDDPEVQRGTIECLESPQNQLQSKRLHGRVVTRGRKVVEAYRRRAPEISEAWPRVRRQCREAEQFSTAFENAVRGARHR